jgi:hypothetical protein
MMTRSMMLMVMMMMMVTMSMMMMMMILRSHLSRTSSAAARVTGLAARAGVSAWCNPRSRPRHQEIPVIDT